MSLLIRISLAVLLLLCLGDMPYGFYILVRILTTIFALTLVFNFFEQKKNEIAFFWCAVALIFQPLIKIPLGKELWNIVDVIVAVAIIILIIKDYKNRNL